MPGSHYFDATPMVPSAPVAVQLPLPGGPVTLLTDRGVFSAGRIDPGTGVLLGLAPPPGPTGDLLDLGCGYGPLAVALARRSPQATVWAVDVNQRAVSLTAANAGALGLGNVRAVTPDLVPPDVRFDTVWSNPPIRIGKDALHELLATWLDRLAPTGAASLVVQRHLGSDSLAEWLARRGHAVRRVGSRKGYRVLQVGPRPPGGPAPDRSV